jgi:hypothetical protein
MKGKTKLLIMLICKWKMSIIMVTMLQQAIKSTPTYSFLRIVKIKFKRKYHRLFCL